MEEKTTKTIRKSLYFENTGETLSVEINLENVSPNAKVDTTISFLDTLYGRTKKELQFDNTGFN